MSESLVKASLWHGGKAATAGRAVPVDPEGLTLSLDVPLEWSCFMPSSLSRRPRRRLPWSC
jgi:hypothetical protein